MTMTGDNDNDQAGQVPGASAARAAVEELVDAGLLDELMAKVDSDGLQLTGEGGFLPEMIKAVLERGLGAELADHLGYEKGDPAGRGSPNSRNGSTPKTLATEVGDVALATPRDRAGTGAGGCWSAPRWTPGLVRRPMASVRRRMAAVPDRRTEAADHRPPSPARPRVPRRA